MTVIANSEIFEAARQAHFAVALHRKEDFEGMRRAGRLAAEVLDLLVPLVAPGVTSASLDKAAYDYVVAHGGIPACLGYRGYRHTVCTSVNHVVCHGIPASTSPAAAPAASSISTSPGGPGRLARRHCSRHVSGGRDQAQIGAADRHHPAGR